MKKNETIEGLNSLHIFITPRTKGLTISFREKTRYSKNIVFSSPMSLLNHLSLIFLLLLWYTISSLANLISKRLLTIFPHPFTITFIQLFHGWIYSIPLLRLMKIPSPIYLHSTRIYYLTVMVPLAMGKFLSQFTSQISLRLVPISYTHTVKALMPLFTVILSRIFLQEKYSIKVSEDR